MYICNLCKKEFAIEFIYNAHTAKCSSVSLPPILQIDDEIQQRTMRINELEMRIMLLERPRTRIKLSELRPPPIGDYMDWIESLVITSRDIHFAFSNGDLFDALKGVLVSGGGGVGVLRSIDTMVSRSTVVKRKILVGRKVIGSNLVVLGYNWDYVKSSDYLAIVEYFVNKFRSELVKWYNENIERINSLDNWKMRYDNYYKNVMLSNETVLVRQLREYIMRKV
jgi:hypothetical protein